MKIIKTPCGTRDFKPDDVMIREKLFTIMKDIFIKYGGQPIDTPVLECLDTVKNIYGEEFNKSVYNLFDTNLEENNSEQKEELLLRYDLTVPFARFIANNGIVSFKRYQIGKVYRKDKPNIKNGRFREFYQCDFDIVGEQTAPMIQEAEILNLLIEVLNSILEEDSYKIKINNREILYSVCKRCNVKDFYGVCTIIDKLDKIDKEYYDDFIKEELTKKGEDVTVIKSIIKFLKIVSINNNPYITLEKLSLNNYIDQSTANNLQILFKYLEDCNIMKNIIFDPTIARGLDYYTGLIYEVIYNDKNIISTTIAAGGRYNNLIGKLTKKNVPAIGISFGIERIVTIVEKTNKFKIKRNTPKVYVATIGKNMVSNRLKLCQELRSLGINTDMSYANNPKMRRQFETVFENNIPYMIIIGENELNDGNVTFKNIIKNEQTVIKKEDAIEFILKN